MDGVLRATEAFFERLGAVEWRWVALALLCHLAKMAVRTRAWRAILAAAYPQAPVRWRDVFGAYVAGVGVNAVLPARGGDVLKLYLVHRRIPGATYPTLAATLLVETLVDVVLASLLVAWALWEGVLPGLDVVPRLPAVDWLWLFQNPRAGAAVGAVALVAGFVLGLVASRRVAAFGARVAQGTAVLRSPRRYLTGVVGWQLLDWAFRLATIALFLRAFDIDATLRNTLLVQVTHSLSTILPLTPAGIGTEQALLVYALSGLVPAGVALSFSVGMKLLLIAANVALGALALALLLRTLRVRRALAGADLAYGAASRRAPATDATSSPEARGRDASAP